LIGQIRIPMVLLAAVTNVPPRRAGGYPEVCDEPKCRLRIDVPCEYYGVQGTICSVAII